MEVAEVAATRRRRALRQLGRQGDEDLAAVETLDFRDRCLLAVEQDMAGANLAVGAAGRHQSIVALPQRRGGDGLRQMTLEQRARQHTILEGGDALAPFGVPRETFGARRLGERESPRVTS